MAQSLLYIGQRGKKIIIKKLKKELTPLVESTILVIIKGTELLINSKRN